MAETAQDKEFKSFGIIRNWMKGGMLITILSISIGLNVWSMLALMKNDNDKAEIVQKVTEQTTERVVQLLRPDIIEMKQKVNTSSNRIDTAVNAIQEITGGKK